VSLSSPVFTNLGVGWAGELGLGWVLQVRDEAAKGTARAFRAAAPELHVWLVNQPTAEIGDIWARAQSHKANSLLEGGYWKVREKTSVPNGPGLKSFGNVTRSKTHQHNFTILVEFYIVSVCFLFPQKP